MIETFIGAAIAMVMQMSAEAIEPPADAVEEHVEETYAEAYAEPAYEEPYWEAEYEADWDEDEGFSAEEYADRFEEMGVLYGEDGTRYTYYSENVLPGNGLDELNENGRHTDDEGYVRDGDGYIAVASSDYEVGTVLDTPWGEAKVYDSGCDSGTVDVYVGW